MSPPARHSDTQYLGQTVPTLKRTRVVPRTAPAEHEHRSTRQAAGASRQHQETNENMHEEGMAVYSADAIMSNNQRALAWCVAKVAKMEAFKPKDITSPLEGGLAPISAVIKHEVQGVEGGLNVHVFTNSMQTVRELSETSYTMPLVKSVIQRCARGRGTVWRPPLAGFQDTRGPKATRRSTRSPQAH